MIQAPGAKLFLVNFIFNDTVQEMVKKRKYNQTSYGLQKYKAMRAWEMSFFEAVLKYYKGHDVPFIAKAIKIDRPNLLRKLKQLKMGPYANKKPKVVA